MYMLVEVAGKSIVRLGLCKTMTAGDVEIPNEDVVGDLYELGDDERGFRELFLLDAPSVCQFPEGCDVELTTVLAESVFIFPDQRIDKAKLSELEDQRNASDLRARCTTW